MLQVEVIVYKNYRQAERLVIEGAEAVVVLSMLRAYLTPPKGQEPSNIWVKEDR